MRANENNEKKNIFLDENWFEHLNGTENGAVTRHKIRNSEVFSRLAFYHFVTNEHSLAAKRRGKTKQQIFSCGHAAERERERENAKLINHRLKSDEWPVI